MPIPTEPVGSLPRPTKLQEAIKAYDEGKIKHEDLVREQDTACLDSIKRMEATGSPIVSDGDQTVEAGGHRAVNACPALSARHGSTGLHARAIPIRPRQRM